MHNTTDSHSSRRTPRHKLNLKFALGVYKYNSAFGDSYLAAYLHPELGDRACFDGIEFHYSRDYYNLSP